MTNHFDGRVFRNLDPRVKAAKGLRDFLRWQRTQPGNAVAALAREHA